MACKQPRSSTPARNQASELSSTSQDALFTHFHSAPCNISKIIDTQEVLEGSANEEDDSARRADGASSEKGASRRDNGTSSEDDGASRRRHSTSSKDDDAGSEDDGASRRDDGTSSDGHSDYSLAVTDDLDEAEQGSIPFPKKKKV